MVVGLALSVDLPGVMAPRLYKNWLVFRSRTLRLGHPAHEDGAVLEEHATKFRAALS
jgi:hypothetical protein